MPPPETTPSELRLLGARIRQLREAAGITQEALAWGMGRSKGYLSDIEAGKKLPTFVFAAEVAAYLGVQVLDLLVDPATPRGALVEWSRTASAEELGRALVGIGQAR